MDVSEVLIFSNADWFTSLINDRSTAAAGRGGEVGDSFCDGGVDLVAILERRNPTVGWSNTHFEVLSVIFCSLHH